MSELSYPKAKKYPDLDLVYAQCSGPGGLKLAEFLADKLGLIPGVLLLDVGMNRGFQSCFLAKEYQVFVVGIDPWQDRDGTKAHVDYLLQNAKTWGVENLILGIQVGVPNTRFAASSFDYVYSTTALEMVRGSLGEVEYTKCLSEIYRVLRPGGLFALGEPMHLDGDVPLDLLPLVQGGDEDWTKYFVTLDETIESLKSVGFEIVDAAYAPDARQWWLEFSRHDPYCKQDPAGEPHTIAVDGGRWLSFGYVIAKKPQTGIKNHSN